MSREGDAGGDGFPPGFPDEARAFLEPERREVSVEVRMLDDELARAERLIADERWARGTGLHTIFARGLVTLLHERGEAAESEERLIDQRTPEDQAAFLLRRLGDLETRYAVMRHSAFVALHDIAPLRAKAAAMSAELPALLEANSYLRRREDELRARVAELERELERRAS